MMARFDVFLWGLSICARRFSRFIVQFMRSFLNKICATEMRYKTCVFTTTIFIYVGYLPAVTIIAHPHYRLYFLFSSHLCAQCDNAFKDRMRDLGKRRFTCAPQNYIEKSVRYIFDRYVRSGKTCSSSIE